MATSLGDTVDKLKDYIEIKAEQMKLNLLAQVSKVSASVVAVSTILLFTFFLVFFLSFGLSNLLNDLLNSSYLGFFIIAGFYLLLVVIMLVLMKSGKIQRWIEALILNSTQTEDEEDH